jgi:hypothetical protein
MHLKADFDCAPCMKKVCTYTGPGVTDEYHAESFSVSPPCFSTKNPELVWQKFNQLINDSGDQ